MLADSVREWTGVGDPERLAQVGDWIIECETAGELFARVAGASRPGD